MRSSGERARAIRISLRMSALPSHASRSRSRRTLRSSRPCVGMRRPSSAPSRASSACRSGRTPRCSRAPASRRCSSAHVARARTPRSSGSTSPRSSSASRSTSRSPRSSAPSGRGRRRSPRPSRRGRPRERCVLPGRRRPRAGRRERLEVRVEQVVVREVRALAEHQQRRDTDVLEARRLRRHLAVGSDHGRLAVAVAQTAVVAHVDVRREVLDNELARGEMELALVVAPLDQLVEGDVRLVDAARSRPRRARRGRG